MRKLMLIALSLFALCSLRAAGIELPPVDTAREANLMQTFADRQSMRDYADRELTLQDLGDLLWAANGFNRDDKRTAATAVNAQEIDVYVCMADGSYLYDARNHALIKVAEGDIRPEVGRGADAKKPPVCLIIVADMSRSPLPDRQVAERMSAYDAGIVSQNIYMFCAGNSLGTVCRAGMDKDALTAGLGLDSDQVIHLNHPVGYVK